MGVTLLTSCEVCGGSDGTHHGCCPEAQVEQMQELREELVQSPTALVSHLLPVTVTLWKLGRLGR